MMNALFEILLFAIGIALAVPMLVVCVECAAALLPSRKRKANSAAETPRVAVLIPAHNEELVIEKTLAGLVPTLADSDRVVVVADNCSDRTAAIAAACGAVVVQRADAERKGKGYALDCGVSHLRSDPPDVVVVIDADCDVQRATVGTVAGLAHSTGQPVQALNLGEFDASTGSVYVVSALANRLINLIRPLGVRRLGLPYRLMGTGMAIPWPILKTASLAGSNLVEDTRLGIDLAVEGHLPLFCPEVRVTSRLPQQSNAFQSQRRRWEHGHLQTAVREVPRLVGAAIAQRRPQLLWMALDLCVPPLALLVLVWLAATFAASTAWLWGVSVWPLALLVAEGAMLATAIVGGWAVYCRHEIPLSALAAVPKYIWHKLPIYLGFLFRRQHDWVRTEREPAAR